MAAEALFDEIPAAGEPLTGKIAPENVRLLEERFEDRRRRLSARLTRWERFRLHWYRKYLHWRLVRFGYPKLVRERDSLSTAIQRMRDEYERLGESAPPNALIAIHTVERRESVLNESLARIQPVVDEYQFVNGRLSAHAKVTRLAREDAENGRAFRREQQTWEHQIRAAWRQLPQCHHRWADQRGNWITDIPRIRRAFLSEDCIRFWIATSEQNMFDRMLQKWRSALPYGVTVDSLTSDAVMKTISATCRRQVDVEISPGNTNVFYRVSRLDSPDGIPRMIPYRAIVEYYPNEQHELAPWPLGVTNNRRAVWLNFRDGPHVLVAGSSGSGKSNTVNVILATLASMNSPDALRVVLVDNKGGIEFTHWSSLPHLLGPVIKSVEDVLPVLERLRRLMERRFTAFEAVRAKNFIAYNDAVTESKRLPRIIIVIDELATLTGLGDLTRDIHQQLTVLSSQGRAVGIHLILATQHSVVDIIPGRIKANMSVRIAGRTPDRAGSEVILGTDDAYWLPKVPGRMAARHGIDEFVVQSPFISDADIEYALRDIRKRYAPGDDSELMGTEPLAPERKFGREQFLEIVIEQLGGHVSYRSVYDFVGPSAGRQADLKALADEIVSDGTTGTVEFRGVTYKAIQNRKRWSLAPVANAVAQESAPHSGGVELALLRD